MRASWRGSINFGLVSVPVELRPAVRDRRLSFRLLHDDDATPIRYERVRDDTGEPVPWDEIVRGYEVAKGDYVVLTDEDFDDAAVERSDRFDITDFVAAGDIDPRYYERSFFVLPARRGARPYALLREALREADAVGLGTIILHRRQHLAAVHPYRDALVLFQMRFLPELVSESEFDFPAADDIRPEEVQMAVQVISSLRGPFRPEKYVDEYEQNLRRIIRARARGQTVALPQPAPVTREPRVLDLMARLRESLDRERRGASSGATTSRARPGPRRPRVRPTTPRRRGS